MIPLATTTLTVKRIVADPTRDGYDDPPARTSAITGLRAHIGGVSGSENIATGDRTITTVTLNCDPFTFQDDDQVVDETTGDTYELVWARRRTALGLDYTYGQLRIVQGVG